MTSWTVGSKKEGRNEPFTIRPKFLNQVRLFRLGQVRLGQVSSEKPLFNHFLHFRPSRFSFFGLLVSILQYNHYLKHCLKTLQNNHQILKYMFRNQQISLKTQEKDFHVYCLFHTASFLALTKTYQLNWFTSLKKVVLFFGLTVPRWGVAKQPIYY